MNQARSKSVRCAIHKAGRVCVFGAGVLLDECYDQLVLSLGKEPDFICDNAPEKWGTRFRGLKCISPRELCDLGEGTAVVIGVRKHEEIYEQLRGMGISDIMVACFDSGRYCLRTIGRLENDWPAQDEKPPVIDVKGMWTLVTGASRGVGRQIAMAMAALGSNIIAHSRRLSHVSELQESCRGLGVQILPLEAELSDPAELEKMLTRLDRIAPRVDILFNNAAIAPHCPSGFQDLAAGDLADCFAVNTIAPVRICRHLLPGMLRRGFGRIVNLSTFIRANPGEIAYSASKAALDRFVFDLAPSLEGAGVMISLADPGWVRTDAGGPLATHAVETVIPGILLGAVLDADSNGRRFSAQEYAGLSLARACSRAGRRLGEYARTWV